MEFDSFLNFQSTTKMVALSHTPKYKTMSRNKPFILADIKDLINQLDMEGISMSRFTEILNEKAVKWRQRELIIEIMNEDDKSCT